MKGILVELRKDGAPKEVHRPEVYARLPDDMIAGRTAHLIFICEHCKAVHELGTWEEVAAVIFSGARQDFSESCIVNQTRGGQ